MYSVNPKEVSTAEFHGLMLGAVAPRPIALASTIDNEGNINLSPFSFFNAFSANPPILVFSPARRVRDNTTKHTLENCLQTKEVVINIVDFSMVEQMSLSSTEYDHGVNEFIKAGFTQIKSDNVTPPRVGEAPAAFECKVNEVISLGENGGAGNLIICEVVKAHFSESILDENNKIDPYKLDAVARMGGNWYTRAQGDSIFEIPKPLVTKGIGFDKLPEHILNSSILTANNLARLANVEKLPSNEEIESFADDECLQNIENETDLHLLARQTLEDGDVEVAWKILMQ